MQQSAQAESRQQGRWTKEEHQRFMYAIMQYGKDWKKVEQYVKTRSGSQVRSHAQKFFTKLQKLEAGPAPQEPSEQQRRQQFSETEFDFQRELNNECTPSTPMELVSLIRKQSKEEGGKINLTHLKKTLQQHQQHRQQSPSPAERPPQGNSNSFKSMSNILSAYEEVNDRQDIQQDESFFISITKKYKRLFRQVEDFDRLIDIHAPAECQPEGRQNRKRSFTIPEGSELADDQLDEKIEEIKKKINTDSKQVKQGKQAKEARQVKDAKKQKKQRKDSQSSIQLSLPPFNRLSTIQQNPREQDENASYRAFISHQALQQPKQGKQQPKEQARQQARSGKE